MKRCSTSLIIKEVRIRTTRYHLTPVRMAVIKKTRLNKCRQGCGEKAAPLHCWWERKVESHCEKRCKFPQKTKNRIKIHSNKSTSDYFLKPKTLIQKDICFLMFITPLFIIAKIWKQPKCPWIDEWIKKI